MARVKVQPRVAQPNLESSASSQEVQALRSKTNKRQVSEINTINSEEQRTANKRIRLEMSTITRDSLRRQGLPPASEPVDITDPRILTCPSCFSKVPTMGLVEFRAHVESCTRPVTGESDSATSSLSPPPNSQQGDNGVGDAFQRPNLDHLTPYAAGQFTIYPNGDVPGDDVNVTADAQPRTYFGKLTDPQHFIKSLMDAEEIPYDVLYGRVKSAASALVHWQNEWIDCDRFIEVTEAIASLSPAKPHKNPRVPKETQIGIGYMDELESFVYGFEYQYHQKKVGLQNPEKQRHANGANQGRELRQRIPTQKAAEADLSTSPDSEGVSTRRRGRVQKAKSQSRDETPATTVVGKKRGRPAKPKAGGSSRLQELQLEEGVEYDTLETTERWREDTEQDEAGSRPGTSYSVSSFLSDDVRLLPGRSLGRGRKRHNTSDFEDALPSNKRIRPNPATTNGFSSEELPPLTRDSDGELTRIYRRTRQDEDGPMGQSGQDTLAGSMSRGQHLRESGKDVTPKESKIVTLKTSNGSRRTLANAALARSAVAEPVAATSGPQDGKDGSKISRASLNMRRRWAAKKQAEALGLPVPKIGRYPKGESAPSTPDVVGSVDPFNYIKPLGGRKRNRDEEPNTANDSVPGPASILPGAVKKRGGRPRKITQVARAELSSEEPAGQEVSLDNNQTPTTPSDNEDTRREASAPKKKGGRPRKKALNIEEEGSVARSHIPGVPAEMDQGHTIYDRNSAKSKVNESMSVEKYENLEPFNGQQVSNTAAVDEDIEAPQLRRTGRVRRQTSAALSSSSQANAFRSGRSSQKSTVTPTPGPMQMHPEETIIKQEAVTGSTMPRKRGRQTNSSVVDTISDRVLATSNMTEDGAPLAKKRRVGRGPNVMSTGNSPAPEIVSEEEGATTQEEPEALKNRVSRKTKTSISTSHVPEVLSDHQATLAESSLRKRGRKPAIADATTTDVDSAELESSAEPPVIKKKGGRPRKNANADPISNAFMDTPVKTEDTARRPAPLTTRARSFGQVNPAEDLTVVREVIDVEPPKKKGSWGGKRVKGVFSSGKAPKSDELPKKQIGTQDSKNELPLTASEMDGDVQEQSSQSISPRRKRIAPQRIALDGEIDHQDVARETSPNILSRPRRAATMFDTTATDAELHNRRTSVQLSAQSRSRRSIPTTASPEIDEEELSVDTSPFNISSRPKRVLKTKMSSKDLLDAENEEASAVASLPTESVGVANSSRVDRKKGKLGDKGAKGTGAQASQLMINDHSPVNAEFDNEDSESEGTRKEKKQLAAKASKSLKNSQSMKARWANGSMHEIMRRKREANLAKKAAAENAENGEVEDFIAQTASAPASISTKRKNVASEVVARSPKRRRTMNATMDGPADAEDGNDLPNVPSSPPKSANGRRMSEYERYQQLSSPLRSAYSRRKRRPAALRASQSFTKFTDGEDDIEMMSDDNEDVETEIKKQFDSEYEHYQGIESSNILQGKRKRKPVMNLEEAMRIEAGDEDDFFIEG